MPSTSRINKAVQKISFLENDVHILTDQLRLKESLLAEVLDRAAERPQALLRLSRSSSAMMLRCNLSFTMKLRRYLRRWHGCLSRLSTMIRSPCPVPFLTADVLSVSLPSGVQRRDCSWDSV